MRKLWQQFKDWILYDFLDFLLETKLGYLTFMFISLLLLAIPLLLIWDTFRLLPFLIGGMIVAFILALIRTDLKSWI